MISFNTITRFSNNITMAETGDIVDWSKCLCHDQKNEEKTLTQFTIRSWSTFKNAAEQRQDEIFNKLSEHWDGDVKGLYHRKCYQNYTNKSSLRFLQKRSGSPSTIASESCPEKRPTRSSVSSTSFSNCIICQSSKTVKATGGIKGRVTEKLTLCQTFNAGETLLNAAKKHCDERIITQLIDKDVVALEVRYHKSCFTKYMYRNQNPSDRLNSQNDQAFQQLISEIEETVILQNKIVSLSELHEHYITLLQKQGAISLNYRRQKLKKRIQKHLGDKIEMWASPVQYEPTIIFSKNMPKGYFADRSYKNQESDDENSECSDSDDNILPETVFCGETVRDMTIKVFQAAKILRKVICDLDDNMPMPPSAEDLKGNTSNIPDILYNALSWLITDSCEFSENKADIPYYKHNIVMSVAQDLIYNTSNGRVKTPKHIALPVTIKQLTGSSQVVELLSKFGHGISRSGLDRVETLIAEKQLQKMTLIPQIMQPNVFTMFCWDNNDILEETVSGKGTTHCTNGIAIQRGVDSCAYNPDR